MKFIKTITNFVLIVSIYLTIVNSSNCENDSTDSEQSNTSIINIECSGANCNVDQSKIFFKNNFLTISSAGSYRIYGDLNGQILIDASEEDFVQLILDEIHIESRFGPTILIAGAKKVTLTLNNESILYDNLYNSNGATIHSLSNLTFNGKGNLKIINRNNITILCNKELKLVEGQITVGIIEQHLMEDKNLIAILNEDGSLKDVRTEDKNLREILSNDKNLRAIPLEQLMEDKNLKLIQAEDGNLRIIQAEDDSLGAISLEQLMKDENLKKILAKNISLTTIIAKNSICIGDNFNIVNELVDEKDIPSDSIGSPGNSGGVGSSPTTTTTGILATTCSSAILSQGYPCCPSNCVVVYVDECGTWGVYSDRWCGCKGGGNNNYSCQPNILRQGYKCCSYHNCRLILKDESGKWGVENGQWCGLHFNCK